MNDWKRYVKEGNAYETETKHPESPIKYRDIP